MANRGGIVFTRLQLITPTSKRLGVFSRSLKTLSDTPHPQREYSSQGWRRKNTYVEQVLFGGSQLAQPKKTVWPDPNLGCLGPKDQRLSLPGNVGLNESLNPAKPAKPTEERLKQDKEFLEKDATFWKSLLKTPTNHQHQVEVLHNRAQAEEYEAEQLEALENSLMGRNTNMECIALPCPDLLRRDLATIFSSIDLSNGPLTAITLSLKSNHDMTCWSVDVEEERDNLIEKFIQTAKGICEEIRKRGQWADFIEPTSGRPYYGVYTNQTFFETDERYRHLGFRIVDLGCCKVISHVKWGTHVFVGSMFTSAPSDCEYLQNILSQHSRKSGVSFDQP